MPAQDSRVMQPTWGGKSGNGGNGGNVETIISGRPGGCGTTPTGRSKLLHFARMKLIGLLMVISRTTSKICFA